MDQTLDYGRLRGKFVVFDGPDGCGKSTQLELLASEVQAAGVTLRRLREPGGTSIGEQIRNVLLSTHNEGMDLRCEMLLYMASRAQLVEQEIHPALARGELVLSDRYLSSTLAYQGTAGGMSFDAVLHVGEIAVNGVWPDLTVIFDIPVDVAMARLAPGSPRGRKGGKAVHTGQVGLFSDRIEQRDLAYHARVREGYLEQAKRWPERYRVVDASGSVEAVRAAVRGVLAGFLG